MESLLRTRVDCFVLEDSLTLSQIEKLRDAGRVGGGMWFRWKAYS